MRSSILEIQTMSTERVVPKLPNGVAALKDITAGMDTRGMMKVLCKNQFELGKSLEVIVKRVHATRRALKKMDSRDNASDPNLVWPTIRFHALKFFRNLWMDRY